MSMIDIYIRDKQTGLMHRVGDDIHDMLTINAEGQLCYRNLQNGDGCRTGETGWDRHKMQVYVLTNFNSTIEQDIERVTTLRDMKYAPYVMVYNKDQTTMADKVRQLQRWVNNRVIFNSCKSFEEYLRRNY